MKITLTKKLAMGFISTAFISILLTALISNYLVGIKFNSYLVSEHKTKLTELAAEINSIYDKSEGLSAAGKSELSRYAAAANVYIEVKDLDKSVLFKTDTVNSMEVNMRGMMRSMGKMSGINLGEYTEESFDLKSGDDVIGSITFGYFGTSYITNAAINFKVTLNQAFLISFIIALFSGLIFSMFFTRQISKPLIKITETANKLRNGNLNARSSVKTKTTEIDDLNKSVNYLADTLQKQEELRKRLTSDIAHELRTPLTILKTHIEAIIDKVWTPDENTYENFNEEIERLIKLVKGLDDISKLEEASQVINKTKFDLSSELEKLANYFSPIFKNKGCNLNMEITQNILVSMDKDKLIQAIYNLISNSLKYTGEKGSVLIKLEALNKSILISIVDEGIGIASEDLPHIFDRFYRTDNSRSSSTGGAGLGLTITKTIVEAHGGKITVDSTLGKGTSFTINIPIQ